jgi:cell wall-associated NlpC family hydrolase
MIVPASPRLTLVGASPILRPMRQTPFAARRSFPASRARIPAPLLFMALALGASATAQAAPDDHSNDPVARFLQDKVLLKPDIAAVGSSVGAVAVAGAASIHAGLARAGDRASDMVVTALNFLGVPYRRGGSGSDAGDGFDCSGFTRHVFGMSLGLLLPRSADEQAKAPGLVAVAREELKPGDLVFFNTLRRTFSHVGIYVGEGKFIHSPKPGAQVRVEDMRFQYWQARFTGARRAAAVDDSATAAASPTTY